MMHKITAFLVAMCVLTTINAQETRQHNSHAHGIAELNIVVEANELVIEFISPSANIVGFEHLPGNSEETESLKLAEQNLNQAENLFALPEDALCTLKHVETDSSLLSANETHVDDEAHVDDETHEEHEEHDDNETHDIDTHSEFHVQYEFQCAEIEKLTEINVNIFNVFPLTESLNVQLLSIAGQSQKTLNKNNTLLAL